MLHYNMGKVSGFIYKNQESHIYFNCANFVFLTCQNQIEKIVLNDTVFQVQIKQKIWRIQPLFFQYQSKPHLLRFLI